VRHAHNIVFLGHHTVEIHKRLGDARKGQHE
jgi:hypothetical protein